MSQTVNVYSPAKPRQVLDASNLAISVPQAGNTVIFSIITIGLKRLFLQVTPTGNAFAGFAVIGQATPAAPQSTLYSAAADYTSPKGLVVGTSGDLTTLAAGSTGWIILDVTGLAIVTFTAHSAAAGGSTVTAYCGGA